MLLPAERAVDLGAQILRQGRSHVGALIAKGDRDFATNVDVEIEAAIRASLASADPSISFLGEEQGGESEAGALCTISLSLVVAGQPVLGIVDAPLLGERFVARQGGGAYLNGRRLAVSEVSGLREAIVGVADLKVGAGSEDENRVHLAVIGRLARESLRMLGSAALDLAWLAAGRLNATVMLSNLPWDVTAGLLLVREAGGMVYDYDGSEHGPASRCTIASVPSLADPMLGIIAEAT